MDSELRRVYESMNDEQRALLDESRALTARTKFSGIPTHELTEELDRRAAERSFVPPVSGASDRVVLTFIHARLVHVHGENPNYDYMLNLARIRDAAKG